MPRKPLCPVAASLHSGAECGLRHDVYMHLHRYMPYCLAALHRAMLLQHWPYSGLHITEVIYHKISGNLIA
jgi:hypothetical protein